jgi:hypothetical protein
VCLGVLGILLVDRPRQGRLLGSSKPLCVVDLCVEEEEHGDADGDREQPLETEQPLPAAQAQDIMKAQEEAGNGAGEGRRHR